MTSRSLIVAAAVALSAALINPAESAAQRQRSPGGNGNGRQHEGGGGGERQRDNSGGGERQRENGGGARQRDGGGGRQREDGGARPQGGGGQAEVRSAQPRDRGGDNGERVRRESPPPVFRESPQPSETRSTPPPATRSEVPSQGDRPARRRVPTEADRATADRGTVTRGAVDPTRGTVDPTRGTVDPNRATRGVDRGNVVRSGGDRNAVVRGADRVPNTSRVAVPRTGPPPRRWDDHNDRNVYGSYYGGRNVYGRYAYHGGRNIYIVPRGYTYYYYPRYYYNPYAFGYGPAGRGHFYFDLYYNSYVWHPYDVYRYGSNGSYGYPVGELRLRVHPRDAQVFIDGYYAGRVDEFDGVFQSLRLEPGEYQVEIVLPGYEPLAFDVRIYPGEKTTYEGDLIPEF
jgi:PEGA domain-containing protein